jgi:anti-sigma B factor antagonist
LSADQEDSRQAPAFALERRVTGRTVQLSCTGELDLGTAPALREASTRELSADAELIVLDLSGVTFMDSSGLHALIDASRALRGRLRVVLGPVAARVVNIAGIGAALPIIPADDRGPASRGGRSV